MFEITESVYPKNGEKVQRIKKIDRSTDSILPLDVRLERARAVVVTLEKEKNDGRMPSKNLEDFCLRRNILSEKKREQIERILAGLEQIKEQKKVNEQRIVSILEPENIFPELNPENFSSIADIGRHLIQKKEKHDENVRKGIPSEDPFTGYTVFAPLRAPKIMSMGQAVAELSKALNEGTNSDLEEQKLSLPPFLEIDGGKTEPSDGNKGVESAIEITDLDGEDNDDGLIMKKGKLVPQVTMTNGGTHFID